MATCTLHLYLVRHLLTSPFSHRGTTGGHMTPPNASLAKCTHKTDREGYLRTMSSDTITDRYSVHLHGLLLKHLLLIAVIFWIWAIVNTATKDYVDLGMISFLTVIVTSVYLLKMHYNSTIVSVLTSNSICNRILSLLLPTLSHILVTLNYALGASMTEHKWGQIYCIIFTVLWTMATIQYVVLVSRVRTGNAKDDSNAAVVPETEDETKDLAARMEQGEMS